ncbi:MAG: FecR/PupR family sigma factor regulator [Opitutaceae bacterium]
MNPRNRSSSEAENAERASFHADAADWLIAHDAGLTPEQQREFDRWLAADPRHAAAWSEAQRAWSRLDRLPELPRFATVPRAIGAGGCGRCGRPLRWRPCWRWVFSSGRKANRHRSPRYRESCA